MLSLTLKKKQTNTKMKRKTKHNALFWSRVLHVVCEMVVLFPEILDPTWGGLTQQVCVAAAPSNLNLSSMSTEIAFTC